MHHPTYMIAHTTAFVAQVVEHWLEQEIAQWAQNTESQSDVPLSLITRLTWRCLYDWQPTSIVWRVLYISVTTRTPRDRIPGVCLSLPSHVTPRPGVTATAWNRSSECRIVTRALLSFANINRDSATGQCPLV